MNKENENYDKKFAARPSGGAADHMRIAGLIVEVMQRVTRGMTERFGDTPVVRQEAATMAHSYIGQRLKLSRPSIMLYLRCRERFGTNPEAIHHLRLTDMVLLLGADISDDLVAYIVAAKKANPRLPRSEVKKLIDGYRRAPVPNPAPEYKASEDLKKASNEEFALKPHDAADGSKYDPLEEIGHAARECFGGVLDETLIAVIVTESLELAYSTRKIFQQHMLIGGTFAHILTRVLNGYVSLRGDTPRIRAEATDMVYGYLERVFRRSRSSVKLYIRCYEKFKSSIDAIETLSVSDMQLLVGDDISDDIVEMVVDAKKDYPFLTKRDIKKLIADYRDGHPRGPASYPGAANA
jgi:hypothetical protein